MKNSRMLHGVIVSLLIGTAQIHAESSADEYADVDAEEFMSSYEDLQLALFDQLRSDTSPRQQVLAGGISIDSSAATNAFRPKPEEVVARAVKLAPDDAFVQWTAANNGSYYSSSCGPTTWPEEEVANLLRLEPDNAAAWRFAVALAKAKGDRDGVDDALSRMAATSRADDHFVEQFEEWRKAFVVSPEATIQSYLRDGNENLEPAILQSAWMRVDLGYSSANSALKNVCTEDAGERTWRRLGWCADAAYVMAAKGGSLDLREQGLELLKAIGERGDKATALRSEYEWLKDHRATPDPSIESSTNATQQFNDYWRGVSTEIEAIERLLNSQGKSTKPPAGWAKTLEAENQHEQAYKESIDAFVNYMRAIVEDLRQSADPHAEALAVMISKNGNALNPDPDSSGMASDASSERSIADIAVAHPDNLAVQWIASSDELASDAATQRLQHLTPGNAAVWAISLGKTSTDDTFDTKLLERMASLHEFDAQVFPDIALLVKTIRRVPPPAPSATPLREADDDGDDNETSTEAAELQRAFMTAYALSGERMLLAQKLRSQCSIRHTEADVRSVSCAAIGRMLLHSGNTLLTATAGAAILRDRDSVDSADAVRIRHIEWWSKAMPSLSKDASQLRDFVEDAITSGDEVQAVQRAMQRLGRAEPPADWKSQAEKRAARKTGGAS